MANKFSRFSQASTTTVDEVIIDPLNPEITKTVSKKTFSRSQPSTSAYQNAIGQQEPLTMLTASETKLLAKTALESTGELEDSVYTYREEFLHVQRVAELGETSLTLLVNDVAAFKKIAVSWGFTVTAKDQYKSNTVIKKSETTVERVLISNAVIDWSRPSKPSINPKRYRQSGNAVNLEDSTRPPSPLDELKAKLNIGVYPSSSISLDVDLVTSYTTYIVSGTKLRYSGSGSGAVFRISVTVTGSGARSYDWGLNGSAGGGQGYSQDERILVLGTALDGNTPNNDVILTVKNVNSTGSIVTSVFGTSITPTYDPNQFYG